MLVLQARCAEIVNSLALVDIQPWVMVSYLEDAKYLSPGLQCTDVTALLCALMTCLMFCMTHSTR